MQNLQQPPVQSGGLVSCAAAREYLGGISLSTLKLLMARGLIPSVKIARRRLIARADLDRYVASLSGSAP